jgi:hypothetical protein
LCVCVRETPRRRWSVGRLAREQDRRLAGPAPLSLSTLLARSPRLVALKTAPAYYHKSSRRAGGRAHLSGNLLRKPGHASERALRSPEEASPCFASLAGRLVCVSLSVSSVCSCCCVLTDFCFHWPCFVCHHASPQPPPPIRSGRANEVARLMLAQLGSASRVAARSQLASAADDGRPR